MSQLYDMLQLLLYDLNSIEITTVNSIFRLVLRMLLGCTVGFERKRKGQSAGVRTFSLISMGATLAMILSIYIPQEYLGLKNGDPGRIAAQVITGVGFIGAGAIIQMKGSVRGLTTAAGIWMVATIGMTVGLGLYIIAITATALILFIFVQLDTLEQRISRGAQSRIIRIRTADIVTDIDGYREVMRLNNVEFNSFYVEYDYELQETRLNLVVLVNERTDFIRLFSDFEKIHPTKAITLANQLSI